MTLLMRQEVSIETVKAFKIFHHKDGKLRSVFRPAYVDREEDLVYVPGERMHVDKPDKTFFAFQDMDYPVKISREGRRRWNFQGSAVIVLPVTLFNVVAGGKFHIPSEDAQCVDGYAPAWESKEIIVHDSQELRETYYNSILTQWWRTARHSMGYVEKQALLARLPHLAEGPN